jgi:hypothetical protein
LLHHLRAARPGAEAAIATESAIFSPPSVGGGVFYNQGQVSAVPDRRVGGEVVASTRGRVLAAASATDRLLARPPLAAPLPSVTAAGLPPVPDEPPP